MAQAVAPCSGHWSPTSVQTSGLKTRAETKSRGTISSSHILLLLCFRISKFTVKWGNISQFEVQDAGTLPPPPAVYHVQLQLHEAGSVPRCSTKCPQPKPSPSRSPLAQRFCQSLLLLNVCWRLPLQPVSCNYIVKQGLCSRGNKVCLQYEPWTSHCMYNRNCWRPFSSCWHAYRHAHVPPMGIPQAHSKIQFSDSYTGHFVRHCSPGGQQASAIHAARVQLHSAVFPLVYTEAQWHRIIQERGRPFRAVWWHGFISCPTSSQLRCSSQSDLDLNGSKKGRSPKRTASYSTEARSSFMLQGLEDCVWIPQ